MTAMEATLTAVDRCDRCGAQAYVRAVLPSADELLFCAHHWGMHREKLEQLAVLVQDETARLAGTPASGGTPV
jgi:hypothetical protein